MDFIKNAMSGGNNGGNNDGNNQQKESSDQRKHPSLSTLSCLLRSPSLDLSVVPTTLKHDEPG
jgi:hypothetical protein